MFQLTRAEQVVVVVLLGGVMTAGGLFYHRDAVRPPVVPRAIPPPGAAAAYEQETIHVDVGGAVWWPRVYALPRGARVTDLLAKALVRDDANLDKLNRARTLRDGEKVFVPSRQERRSDPSQAAAPAGPAALVDVNTAGLEELDSLPGIGPARARAIIAYREQNGSFRSAGSLSDVPGISESLVRDLSPLITAE